ncbi:MAG: flagellar hook-basal body complex protein [Bacillus sp. (in: firmicutes)]
MLRSMYSGISGLKNFQTKLDVIGNNISNVNTFGFKKSRVTFKDMISQSVAGASASTDTKGGTNPMQVGLGSSISAIDTIHTQGNLQSTGRLLDLAISGDGYFVVANGSPENLDLDEGAQKAIGMEMNYTRAGNFYLDSEGYLVNADGLYVVGINASSLSGDEEIFDEDGAFLEEYPHTIKIPTTAKDMSIGADGTVTYIAGEYADEDGIPIPFEDGSDDSAVKPGDLVVAGRLILAKFSNTGGLQKSGNNLFQPTTNSGDPVYAFSGQSGTGAVASSTLEMSNVDLSEEFTEMIVAQRAFQANTRIITTSDEILQELVNLKR